MRFKEDAHLIDGSRRKRLAIPMRSPFHILRRGRLENMVNDKTVARCGNAISQRALNIAEKNQSVDVAIVFLPHARRFHRTSLAGRHTSCGVCHRLQIQPGFIIRSAQSPNDNAGSLPTDRGAGQVCHQEAKAQTWRHERWGSCAAMRRFAGTAAQPIQAACHTI